MKFERDKLNMFGRLGILGPISGGIPFEMFLWRMLERKKQYKFRKLRLMPSIWIRHSKSLYSEMLSRYSDLTKSL